MADFQVTYNGVTQSYSGSQTFFTAGKIMATDFSVSMISTPDL